MGNEEFYSVDSDHQEYMDAIPEPIKELNEEEDEDENEYHNEEKVVSKRIDPYRADTIESIQDILASKRD